MKQAHLPSKISLLVIALFVSLSTAFSKQRPNIIFILVDDMGYSDIGCYGGEVNTPHLDRLAENGLRFTSMYNTSKCFPSRACLLTGVYAQQCGMNRSSKGIKNAITMADLLRTEGYRTLAVGKHHSNKSLHDRGFDRFYGTVTGAGSFFDPTTLCRDNTYVTPENDAEYQPDRFYYTDAISDQAVRFVREHGERDGDEPFFLYVAYTTAHWPMHALEDDIAKYEGVYDEGFEAIRAARLARAREQGVLDASWQLSAIPRPWAKTPNHAWESRNMQVYAAMIDRMDQGIGRLIAELERQQQLDDTLVIYLQDNGGCAEGMGRQSNAEKIREKTYQPLGKDGLQPKIWPPMQTRDGRAVRTGPGVDAGPEDTYIGYGRGWANVSNTPFRGYKHDALEGGISTPFIVRWPGGIPRERRGAIDHTPAHLIDVLPTLLAAAGASCPERNGDTRVQPLEGIDLLPALRGGATARAQPICFEHHGNLGLREGRWKIVSAYRKDQPISWQLYDMQSDRSELHDLAAAQPERVRALATKWQAWADRVGVQPWPIKPRSR